MNWIIRQLAEPGAGVPAVRTVLAQATDVSWMVAGAMELKAGQMSYIPRGVAHRITGSPGFLRMVLYSRKLVHPKSFNNISERETRFDVQ